ncbi:hypothetical protein M2347_004001 [Chryseobacterium sp. H1D6B]|uniref:hypothetical protein n=1 Tax=Chryseobacterium sp. H1D6B TaxID=2940588 RepID=UPI0015CC491A|nr:hypothetical protein [Chryseobacterium sp. H1D6B]MDH6254274.1 hypothetical protein [Chryseobacterium sp. H1D6B]
MEIFTIKQRYYCLIFWAFLCPLFFTVYKAQERKFRSETLEPKTFQNSYYRNYDLVGKVKTSRWIVSNYETIGNTDKYYYIGYTDYIDLNFNNEGEPSLVKLLTKSIKAYKQPRDSKIENIVYEKEPVILLESSSIEDISIDYLNYTKHIDINNKLISKDTYFTYFYNEYGDLQDYNYISLNKDEQARHFQFIYKYDTKGNWTERILYEAPSGKDPSQKKEEVQKITRSITYY